MAIRPPGPRAIVREATLPADPSSLVAVIRDYVRWLDMDQGGVRADRRHTDSFDFRSRRRSSPTVTVSIGQRALRCPRNTPRLGRDC